MGQQGCHCASFKICLRYSAMLSSVCEASPNRKNLLRPRLCGDVQMTASRSATVLRPSPSDHFQFHLRFKLHLFCNSCQQRQHCLSAQHCLCCYEAERLLSSYVRCQHREVMLSPHIVPTVALACSYTGAVKRHLRHVCATRDTPRVEIAV